MKKFKNILVGTALLGVLLLLSGVVFYPVMFEANNELPELVSVAPGSHVHRLSGEFLKNNSPVDAPKKTIHFSRTLDIMKYQVLRVDYARCVAENICDLPFGQTSIESDPNDKTPITGVSYIDAINYAGWLSARTGVTWRLPTDAEWAYSAGARFFDDATDIEIDSNDPSRRMLSKYKQSIELNREADPHIRPRGGFGANENGLFDQSGNVWEWTETCYSRTKLGDAGKTVPANAGNCGVRVVEGRHRSYMPVFIKDAKSGGCGVGTPPDFLGFRLVKDDPPALSLRRLSNWL